MTTIVSTVKFCIDSLRSTLYKDLSKIFCLHLSKITSDANRNKKPDPSGL